MHYTESLCCTAGHAEPDAAPSLMLRRSLQPLLNPAASAPGPSTNTAIGPAPWVPAEVPVHAPEAAAAPSVNTRRSLKAHNPITISAPATAPADAPATAPPTEVPETAPAASSAPSRTPTRRALLTEQRPQLAWQGSDQPTADAPAPAPAAALEKWSETLAPEAAQAATAAPST